MKQYKHIIWDWNGTLLDDLQMSIDALNSILVSEQMEIVTDVEEYKKIFQFPVIRYYEAIGFDFNKTPFSELAKRYMAYYQPHSLSCKLQTGAIELLQALKKADYRLTLLSASDLSFLHVQLSQYPDLEGIFDEVLGLDHIHADSKQSLAIKFVQTLKHPEKVLFIGDSVHEYEVASASGCDCLLVGCGHEHVDKLKQCDCDYVEHLSDVANRLLG